MDCLEFSCHEPDFSSSTTVAVHPKSFIYSNHNMLLRSKNLILDKANNIRLSCSILYKRTCGKLSLHFYPELLQWAESSVETVLRQAAGQEVDPCLLWSLSVHLFRIHVKVLQYGTEPV